MSRAPPFPTRRRSPSVTNGIAYTQAQPSSAPGTSTTRPLQIARPGSRPTTPVGGYTASSPSSYAPPNTAPLGPSRPQRSELRNRPEYANSDRTSSYSSQGPYNRDSIATSRSDVSGTPYRTVPASATNGPSARQRPSRVTSPVSDDGDNTTPTSLNTALSAFQSAGSKKRQVDDDDYQYQRERELELAAEQSRQQRIRERAPGMRSRGNTRAGEIDGMQFTAAFLDWLYP